MSEKGGGTVKLDYIKIKVGSGGIMQGGNQSNFSKNIRRSRKEILGRRNN